MKTFLNKVKEKYATKYKRTDIIHFVGKDLPFSYRVLAVPTQILQYNQPLDDKQKNIEYFNKISEGTYIVLHTCEFGELRMYQQVIAFINEEDKEKPIKFSYVFYPTEVDGKEAIQNFHMWREHDFKYKIENLSLRQYCIFKALLPEVDTIISADQHTPDGENAAKRTAIEGLDHKLFVYILDDQGKLTRLEKKEDLDNLWGPTKLHGKKLTVISRISLD